MIGHKLTETRANVDIVFLYCTCIICLCEQSLNALNFNWYGNIFMFYIETP